MSHNYKAAKSNCGNGFRNTREIPSAAVWVSLWQDTFEFGFNNKKTCGVSGLSFKALNWYSGPSATYWMCVQLWRHNYSRICCTFRGRELVIGLNPFSWTDATDRLAWETFVWHSRLISQSFLKTYDPKKTEFHQWCPSTAKFEAPPPLFSHSPGPTFVRALTQLELDVGAAPEARHPASDLQRPRTFRRSSSVLASAQQRRHCTAGHQHLQPLGRFWLSDRGLFRQCRCRCIGTHWEDVIWTTVW